MLVRRETPADYDAVAAVHDAAFGGPSHPALTEALRAGGYVDPALSLVAVDAEDHLVGHVVCSRGDLDGRPAQGLGPIGVLPDRQGDGVGSALMHAVLGAADALGEPFVVLLGDPAYYRRFGFVAAREHGIEAPDPSWGEYFQVRTLSAWESARHDSLRGTFTYAPPFDDVE
jgi:putative acetyltransferase